MAPDITEQQHEVLRHIAALIEGHKSEINIHYSELKLRLPSYLKNVTIQQLRDAGATVDPNINIPRGAADIIQKQAAVNEKLDEVRECFREQVRKYYDNIKKKIPREMLSKNMGDLSDEEWNLLGIDVSIFKR